MKIRGYRVLYLDPEEDINSLLAELGDLSTDKIALVVHQNSNIFYSRINIQLLQKYLNDWDKDVVFISTDMRLIRIALEMGQDIYPDLDALENEEQIQEVDEPLVTSLDTEELLPELSLGDEEDEEIELPMRRSRRRQKKSWGRKVFIALFALVILLGLTWFYVDFPLITVEVSPTIEKMPREFQLTCERGLDQIKREAGKIPLHNFHSKFSGEVTVPTTGRRKIGFTRSQGVVLFINNTKSAIKVPANTQLQTSSGLKFKTVETVNVPPVEAEYMMDVLVGMKAGKAEVNIVALKPGIQGNVSSGRIKKFAGKDYNLKVVNPEATRGGADREEMVVSQADLDRAMGKLKTQLKKTVTSQLTRKIGNDYLVLNDTVEYELGNVEVNNQVDEKAEEITVTGQMVASGYTLMKDDLELITSELYLAQLPNYYNLYSQNIQISRLETKQLGEGKIQLNLEATGQVVAQIESEEIVKELKGQSVDYAQNVLSKMKEIKYFRIFADGKTRIPRFTFAIRIVVRDPTETEEGSI